MLTTTAETLPAPPSSTDRRIAAMMVCIMPAATAAAIAGYILRPDLLPEDFDRWAALILLAEVPLCLMGAVWVGVASVPGPVWRRLLVYALGMALLLCAMWMLFDDPTLGPLLLWTVAGQVCTLIWQGPDHVLAVARAEAIGGDTATLLPPMIWITVAAGLALVVYADTTGTPLASVPWHQLWWGAVGYFLLRVRSIAHAYSAAFLQTRRSYCDSGWRDRTRQFCARLRRRR